MDGLDDTESQQWEQYRSYLLLVARMSLDRSLRGKIDASDIVQQTLLEAHAQRARLPRAADELCLWLRTTLANNLRDQQRYLRRRKRDITREQPLDAPLAASSQKLLDRALAGEPSPSRCAMRAEEVLRLAQALWQLPEAQREAIVLHHLEGRTLSQIAQELGKSEAAVAGLLHRGLRTLRKLLDSSA